MLSRDEALRPAEVWAELGALKGVVVLILLFAVMITLLVYKQYVYAVMVAALMVLSVFVMVKASKYSEVF